LRDGQVPAEIREQLGQPATRDEALVDDRPAGRRRDRELGQGGVTARRLARRGLQLTPSQDEATFERRVADRRAIWPARAGDDGLRECRPCGCRGLAERARIGWHSAPDKDLETCRGEDRV